MTAVVGDAANETDIDLYDGTENLDQDNFNENEILGVENDEHDDPSDFPPGTDMKNTNGNTAETGNLGNVTQCFLLT